MTHCALMSGKYEKFIANDIDGRVHKLWWDAIAGKYQNEADWISREEFNARKAEDGYAAFCWSFGNNGRDYLYSREIEPYKKAYHEAVFGDYTAFRRYFPDCPDFSHIENLHERRLAFQRYIKSEDSVRNRREVQELENLERLASLERLEFSERLQSLQSLQSLQLPYNAVKLPENAVILADPPYKGTNVYSVSFDSGEFHEWALEQQLPVFICGYEIPNGFREIGHIGKMQTLCATKNATVTEYLYGNESAFESTERQITMF